MRRNNLRILLLLAPAALSAAEPMSRPLLVALLQAGVSPAALVRRIDRDGVAFRLTPAVQQELAALSPGYELPAAIQRAAERSTTSLDEATPAEPLLPRTTRELAEFSRQGKIAEVFAGTRTLLAKAPADSRLNCALGHAALGLQQTADAAQALDSLIKLTDPVAQACAPTLRQEIDRQRREQEIKRRLVRQVEIGDYAAAGRVIDESQFEPDQKLVLHYYLDRSTARFASALAHLASIGSMKDSLQADRAQVMDEARQFQTLLARARWFVTSPAGTSSCSPESGRNLAAAHGYNPEEYFKTVRTLAELYPSNELVAEFTFHSLLYLAPMETVRSFGEGLLARQGHLRIPFLSKNGVYYVVIDTRKRIVEIQRDPALTENRGLTDGLSSETLTTARFEEIKRLRQDVSVDSNTLRLSGNTAVLRLEPSGTAPYLGMLPIMYCLYGEKFARQAAFNTGRFLAETLALPASSVDLVNPNKTTRDWAGAITQAGAVAAVLTAGVAQGVQTRTTTPTFEPGPLVQMATTQANDLIALTEKNALVRTDAEKAQTDDLRTLQGRLAHRGFDLLEDQRTGERVAALVRFLDLN